MKKNIVFSSFEKMQKLCGYIIFCKTIVFALLGLFAFCYGIYFFKYIDYADIINPEAGLIYLLFVIFEIFWKFVIAVMGVWFIIISYKCIVSSIVYLVFSIKLIKKNNIYHRGILIASIVFEGQFIVFCSALLLGCLRTRFFGLMLIISIFLFQAIFTLILSVKIMKLHKKEIITIETQN